MAEINIPISKDRIAADILIAAVSAGLLRNAEGMGTYKPNDLAEAFKTIRKALD